jgi:hypothetical protein
MVPIYESDVAEQRWSQAEWEHYELWERVENRLRRKKQLWILATALVFLALSSIPIVMDRAPKWQALSVSRRLAQKIGAMKRMSALEHVAFRVRLRGADGIISYEIQKGAHCSDPVFTPVESGELVGEDLALLDHAQARAFGVPGAIEEFCYDPYRGSDVASRGEAETAFAILPVKDLTSLRTDRIALLLLSGDSAEISFE